MENTDNSPVDAATLDPSERAAFGITTELPKTLAQSLQCLEANAALQELLGKEFVKYIAVKRAESAALAAMGKEERRKWLVERY